MKKFIILTGIIIVIAFLFPKPMDYTGGLRGELPKNNYICAGLTYVYNNPKCNDCYSTEFCVGIPFRK